MVNNNLKALKSGIWYTIANFFTKGLIFITIPIFTRIMTSDEIGEFANISAWFYIFLILASFQLQYSIALAKFDYQNNFNSYLCSILFLSTIISSIWFTVILLFTDFFSSILSIQKNYIILMFVCLLIYPAIEIFQTSCRVTYRYKEAIIISLIVTITSTLCSLIFTLISNQKLDGRVYGYFIPLIIIALYVYIYIIKNGKTISKEHWKYSLIISSPLILHALAGNLLQSSDRIMILKLQNASEAGLYSIASMCAIIVSVLWASMNTAWSPWAYDKMNNKEFNDLRIYSKPYFIFFFLIAIIFMLIAPELLYIMGGNEYIIAAKVIPPIMCGYIFQFIYSLYVNIEYFNKKQKFIAFGTVVSAILNVILNYIFIPTYGYVAAAYTTLISYMFLYLIHWSVVKKIGCSSWYDGRFFVICSVMAVLFCIVITILYDYNIIRYIIIFAILLWFLYLMYIKKAEIKMAIKNKSLKDLLKIYC